MFYPLGMKTPGCEHHLVDNRLGAQQRERDRDRFGIARRFEQTL
jgi:hypothetical protein